MPPVLKSLQSRSGFHSPVARHFQCRGASYAVEVVNLVKEFRVYHRSFGSLKSHAAALAKTLVRRETQSGFDTRRALGGVSFQIAAGEAVALVGRNGSGKSTLLSILSRIYLPTSGEARLRGTHDQPFGAGRGL